ncbi:hypothetical protein J6590_087285 [Homalodisca vitripennis]|nr:hypothetical protein J6590_087285 [Homalodisca vitripennis]
MAHRDRRYLTLGARTQGKTDRSVGRCATVTYELFTSRRLFLMFGEPQQLTINQHVVSVERKTVFNTGSTYTGQTR